ncbi:MAG: hypothetical protein GX808_06505 [Syntrophomonadaceae bacterium]|nr:hypothetical protein [Syntrophomonadaceae bacterium]
MKRLGLVLGGGGLKGLAHIGVLQVLVENKIPIASISGTSSGSIIAALFASGMSPYRMEEVVLNLKPSDYLDYNITGIIRYGLSLMIPGENYSLDGLIKGEKLESQVAYLTNYQSLGQVKIPLAIIACDINTGQEVIFCNQDYPTANSQAVIVQDALLSEAVRCSTSIPGVFVPRRFNGMSLVDGGLKAVVPVAIQLAMGAEFITTVNLGKESYVERVSGIPQIIGRAIDILIYETSDTAETLFADLCIYPNVPDVRLDELYKAPFIIRAGRRAMLAHLQKLKKGLQCSL